MKLSSYKIFNYLIVPLIVVIVFSYVLYSNVKPFGGTVIKKLDVGSNDALNPLNRVTEVVIETNGTTYKELENNLVYFDIERVPHANNVKISVRFKDNLPTNSDFKIGGKDAEEWHYLMKPIYSKPNTNETLEFEPLLDDGWVIGQTTFNLTDLYLNNNKYSFVLNLDHLAKKKTQNMTIAVDWIEVDYYVEPLIKWTNRD